MTTNDEFTNSGELFRGILAVFHVAKVVFALSLVLVTTGEIVLGKLEGNRKQDMKGIQDFGVE